MYCLLHLYHLFFPLSLVYRLFNNMIKLLKYLFFYYLILEITIANPFFYHFPDISFFFRLNSSHTKNFASHSQY